MLGFCKELPVPSPKFQDHARGDPEEVSVNWMAVPATTLEELLVKLAAGVCHTVIEPLTAATPIRSLP